MYIHNSGGHKIAIICLGYKEWSVKVNILKGCKEKANIVNYSANKYIWPPKSLSLAYIICIHRQKDLGGHINILSSARIQ